MSHPNTLSAFGGLLQVSLATSHVLIQTFINFPFPNLRHLEAGVHSKCSTGPDRATLVEAVNSSSGSVSPNNVRIRSCSLHPYTVHRADHPLMLWLHRFKPPRLISASSKLLTRPLLTLKCSSPQTLIRSGACSFLWRRLSSTLLSKVHMLCDRQHRRTMEKTFFGAHHFPITYAS